MTTLTGRRHKALVVDDELEAREELRAACAALGHDVLVATTIEEATAVLAGERPCYAIVDNFLPLKEGMTPWARAGTNLLRELRKRFTPKQLPVIVVTGRGAGDDVVAAFKAGMNDFAFKPFDRTTDEPLDRKIRDVLDFACNTRRACPHQGGDDAARVYGSERRLLFVGDLRRGRALLEVDDRPSWVQRNTFELLWRLRVEELRADGKGDGWVHAKAILFQPNHSLIVSRALADLAKVAQADDLLEWQKGDGRVRLCVAPERTSHDPAFMKQFHRDLLKLLP